jgi:enamine deaminase RidA (YjgF/YER057c/UK114 family)
MRDVRTKLFERTYPDGDYPPHTLLVVAGLAAPEYLIEIEATGAIPAAD